jgi:dienelactone hydrolase
VKRFAAALASLLVLLAPLALAQDPLAGAWTGKWIRNGSSVDITMRIAASPGGYIGTFDSNGLRVSEIPMQEIHREGQELVAWKVAGDSSTMAFAGKLEGETLKGRFLDRGQEGAFEFKRGPMPPLPRREEVAFKSGPVNLSGTLIVPESKACKRHPAIVFVQGSGPEGRWASTYLAVEFARRGFAALVYDKRGVGKSTGDWKAAGFEELAADAVAAIEFLRARADVDSALIGIHGHSQGGTIAPLVAAKAEGLAFVIGSAAAATMGETEIYSLENSMRVKELSADDAKLAKAYARAVVETAYGGAPREQALQAAEKVRGKPWAFALPPESHPYWAFSKRIASYRPVDYWRRIAVPALLVYGELDERVPPGSAAEAITAAYRKGNGPGIEVITYRGADHGFRVPSNARGFAWPKTVAAYPDSMLAWAVKAVSVSASKRGTDPCWPR